MAQIDLKNATIKLLDGTTPTPKELEINVGEGSFSFTEHRTLEYTLNRGALSEVRAADEEPMDVSFDFVWDFLKSSTGGTETVEDVLKNRAEASDWVSTDSDECRPFSIDIEIEYTPDCSGEDIETILLEDFRYEELSHDPVAGTVSCTGRCNVTQATSTRTSQ